MDISTFTSNYLDTFKKALDSVEVTNSDNLNEYSNSIKQIVELISNTQQENKKVMMVGNGGSAGITSHMAVDFWKNGGIRATAFNDSSLLTCIANDLSYEEVFSKPIEMFADKGDVVFCISSSGNSKNILNAAAQAAKSNCTVITFSGFNKENPLRKLGNINFYVPSYSYGLVEIIHNLIIHNILDAKLYCNDKKDVFNKNLPYETSRVKI